MAILGTVDKVVSLNYEGDLSRGGWQMRFTVLDDADVLSRWDAVRILERDYWTRALIPEPERLGCLGYVLPSTRRLDWDRSAVDVVATTSHAVLDTIILPRLSFRQTATPENPHDFPVLRLANIVLHILMQHTNMAWNPAKDTHGWLVTRNIKMTQGDTFGYYSIPEGSIWSTIQKLANQEVKITFFNKHDDLYYGYHPMFDSPLPAPVLEMTADYWFGEDGFRPIPREHEVRQVVLTGEKDSGDSIVSRYPTQAQFYGWEQRIRVAANTQSTLDTMAEYLYRFASRNWDLEVRTWLTDFELGDRIDITHSSAGDGIEWNQKPFYVESVSVSYDFEAGTRETTLRLNEGV